MTRLVSIGIFFLALFFASPALAIDQAGGVKVGDIVAANGACTKPAVLSLLWGQKSGGTEGFMTALIAAEETGQCLRFQGTIDVQIKEIEHYGVLSDGDNFILGIGNGLWLMMVVDLTGS